MLISVKPGSVLISFRKMAPVPRSRKKSTRARPLALTAQKARMASERIWSDSAAGMSAGMTVREPTPTPPVAPQTLTAAIDTAAATLGGFDRVSVGFPGAVREGRVLTAPNLGTELWADFDLQTALAGRWGKPVRVMNDADVQGFGAIAGKGVEMVLTLGTGAGTSIFYNGQIMPHLEPYALEALRLSDAGKLQQLR